MATQSTDLRGVIQGNTIVLDHESGFPNGQVVAVTVQPVADDDPAAEQAILAEIERIAPSNEALIAYANSRRRPPQ
jgi:hypothetical protein